jgi:hypothetical protein
MTYAAHPAAFHGHLSLSRRAAAPQLPARPGILRRLFDAVYESRARAAEREAAVFLARTGGRFTDSIERELNDRHFSGGWNLRR